MNVIVHITDRSRWAAVPAGGALRPASLATAGFVHCSVPRQVLAVAESLFSGQAGLVLLLVDPDRLTSPVRWETVGADRYPHVYGPLDQAAVVAVLPLTAGADGHFALPAGLTEEEISHGDGGTAGCPGRA